MDFSLLGSSEDSDWSLFAATDDNEISLEDISDINSSLASTDHSLDELFFDCDISSQDLFSSSPPQDYFKLEDISNATEISESVDSLGIHLEDLQESPSDSSPASSSHIPDFDQLQNLPHEIVERSRSSLIMTNEDHGSKHIYKKCSTMSVSPSKITCRWPFIYEIDTAQIGQCDTLIHKHVALDTSVVLSE
jgi:hypothetical protein